MDPIYSVSSAAIFGAVFVVKDKKWDKSLQVVSPRNGESEFGLLGEQCHPGCLGAKRSFQSGLSSFHLCLEHRRVCHYSVSSAGCF